MSLRIKEIVIKARIEPSSEEDRPSSQPDRSVSAEGTEARPPLGERFLKQYNSQKNER